MSSIVIENLPPEVIDRLQMLADRHERTLSEEIVAILSKTAENEARDLAWAKIDLARERHAGRTFSDSAELLREDRTR